MKAIILTACAIFSLNIYAQTKGEVKKMANATNTIDEQTQLISYKKTVETSLVDSVLYKRSTHWYKTVIKSMRIQADETKLPTKIVGRGEMDLKGIGKPGSQPTAFRLKYTLITTIDGNKVTFDMTRFNVQNTIYSPCEPWIKKQDEEIDYKWYLIFIEEESQKILDNIAEFVNVEKAK